MRARLLCIGVLAIAACCGCTRSAEAPQVVVYAALDSEFSQPIFDDFTEQTGVQVLPKFDAESTKTVGLVQAILAERERPRCDVFWNNEILNTLRLERAGLLKQYIPPAAANYPPQYRAADGAWHGFAARARVLIVNTRLVAEADRPDSIYDLADPRWRGRTGIAKPLFGTTLTHAACLFAALGDEKAKELFRGYQQNGVQILSGNKQVALSVAGGQLAFGLTDTDDALVEIDRGSPVVMVYPDQQEGGLGTLFIPNSLAIIAGAPHAAEAEKLVDYLLSAEVESRLATGPSGQIPLHAQAPAKSRAPGIGAVRAMQVDYNAAADKLDAVTAFIQNEFASDETAR